MAKSGEKKGLGRGLSALLADVDAPSQTNPSKSGVETLPIDQLKANPDQPRLDFTEEALSDLTNSIKEHGIIQPLIVRRLSGTPPEFQIVAGERRWRAAQRAQLHDVPVVVRNFTDQEVLEVAIIENIQRADLNPVEEALGYRQLMDRFGHTQEALSDALGKSRSHIANLLRLLNLPKLVQDLLVAGKISAGHARVLVPLENAEEIAREIVAKGLSVRQVEALAKKPRAPKIAQPSRSNKDPDTIALENDLSAAVGLKVSIQHGPSGEAGELRIKYRDLEDLDGLCQLLSQ